MSFLERPFQRQVRHVDPAVRDSRTAAVRRQIQRDFGMLVPPFALHLPAPDILCAYWAVFREPTYGRRVDRAQKEAVAAAVSAINACPYCVDVHTTMLDALGQRAPAAAIVSQNADGIVDPTLQAVVTWAQATRQPDAPILQQRPFPDEHAPELIGIAVAYHYINRMVNIFAVASPFPSMSPRITPMVRRVAAVAFRRLLARDVRPGASLDLLRPAPLPDDLSWARPDPIIADAFGRAASTIDAAGQQVLPAPVRELVAARVHAWRGEDPGLSRSWVERAIEALPAQHRPIGRLTLLTALASYQVDDQVLDDARTQAGPAGDQALVTATAWASFLAARRIGSWLSPVQAPAPSSRSSRQPLARGRAAAAGEY